MIDKELDRLLDNSVKGIPTVDMSLEEYESLKAKIDGKIEKGNKFDNIQESLDSKRSIFMPMKDYEELKSQVAKLKEERDEVFHIKNVQWRELQKLKSIIDEIEKVNQDYQVSEILAKLGAK